MEPRLEGGGVGREGEIRNTYSAAVIDGINRNSKIFVGYSIVKKTDSRLGNNNNNNNNNGRNCSFLHGWLPHGGKEQMACKYCFPTRTMF